jgi:hypothetical protein
MSKDLIKRLRDLAASEPVADEAADYIVKLGQEAHAQENLLDDMEAEIKRLKAASKPDLTEISP